MIRFGTKDYILKNYCTDGVIKHNDDCLFSSIRICSCGLLHNLRQNLADRNIPEPGYISVKSSKLYPDFEVETTTENFIIDLIIRQNWDFVSILTAKFKSLSEEQQIKCLITIGIINKPKKISKAVMHDIIKLVKTSKKLHALWDEVMNLIGNKCLNPFKENT